MNAVIYTRVSSKEQVQNLSLSTQRKACEEYCQRNGIRIDRIFIEEGESAKTADRSEFQKLLTYCRENKGDIDYVVVYSISRFARSTYDHAVISGLLNKSGISLRSVTEPISDGSSGKLMENMLAAFAQFDNDVRGERTTEGMKAALEKGQWPFKVPLGYKTITSVAGKNKITHDPERAPLIARAFELYGTGELSKLEVLRVVTSLGLRGTKGQKLNPQTFDALLRKPIYAGILEVKGWPKQYRGNFKPIISEDLFRQVLAILAGKRVAGKIHLQLHPDFPLRHFVKCGYCNRPLTASWSKGRKQKYPYYRCPNSQCKRVNIRKERLESLFIDCLAKLKPDLKYLKLFHAIILDCWKEKQAQVITLTVSLQQRVEDLKIKQQALLEAFIYRKVIDEETYADQDAKLKQEIAIAQIELNEAQLEELDVEGILDYVQHLLSNAERLWFEFSIEQKERFQHIIFPEGLTFSAGKFGTAVTCSFFKILENNCALKTSLATRHGFEP